MTVLQNKALLNIFCVVLCGCSSAVKVYDNESFYNHTEVYLDADSTNYTENETRNTNDKPISSDLKEFTKTTVSGFVTDANSTILKRDTTDLIKTAIDLQKGRLQLKLSNWTSFAGCGFWKFHKHQTETTVRQTFLAYFDNTFIAQTDKFECLMYCSSGRKYKYFLFYKSICKCFETRPLFEPNDTSCIGSCDNSFDVYCNKANGAPVFDLSNNLTDSLHDEDHKTLSNAILDMVDDFQCLINQDDNYTIATTDCKTVLSAEKWNKYNVIFRFQSNRYVQWRSNIDDQNRQQLYFRTITVTMIEVKEHTTEHKDHDNYSIDTETSTDDFITSDDFNKNRLRNNENHCLETYFIVNAAVWLLVIVVIISVCSIRHSSKCNRTADRQTPQPEENTIEQNVHNNPGDIVSSTSQIDTGIYSEIDIIV